MGRKYTHLNDQIIIVVFDTLAPLMQDYASNSSHSSLRGSARTSLGEEHPVNPVVSISLPIEITLCVYFLCHFLFCGSYKIG